MPKTKVDVPQEMLLDGARMLMTGMTAGTMGFLKGARHSYQRVGRLYRRKVRGLTRRSGGRAAGKVMEHLLALEILPMGVEMISSDVTDGKADVKVTSLPSQAVLEKFGTTPRELLSGFGVTQREMSTIFAMYEPAAKAIGLRFSHELKNGKQVIQPGTRAAEKGRTSVHRRAICRYQYGRSLQGQVPGCCWSPLSYLQSQAGE